MQRSNKGATTLAQPTFTHTSSKNREKQRGQRKVSIFISSLPPPLLLKAITYQCLSVLSSFLSFLLLVRIRFSISFFIADNIYIERGIYSCLHHLIHLFHVSLPLLSHILLILLFLINQVQLKFPILGSVLQCGFFLFLEIKKSLNSFFRDQNLAVVTTVWKCKKTVPFELIEVIRDH